MTYLYRGCHASVCPPALTISWCPLDHCRNHFASPVFLAHITGLKSLHFTVACWSNVGWSWSKWCTLELGERIAYNHMLHYPISQAPKKKDLVFTVLYMLCLLTHMLDGVMIPKIRIPRELHNSILLYWPCLTIIIYHTMPSPVEIVAWATCDCIVYRYLYLDIFILRCWLSCQYPGSMHDFQSSVIPYTIIPWKGTILWVLDSVWGSLSNS